MKIKRCVLHSTFIIVGLLIILTPTIAYTNTYWRALLSGTVDAITSPSVILERPGGTYFVFINEEFHDDSETLDVWISFFNGEEVSYIFEDISCSVAGNDTGAIKTAESFQSRLPQNQMGIMTENSQILASRLDERLFDIVIMSEEFVETADIDMNKNSGIVILNISDN